MPTNRLDGALEHLRRTLASHGEGLTDAQLLASFVGGRDEGAFAALVRRHGPMVLGVCRRVLRHEQDAEDAFQATFLLLARKAPSVRKRAAVGSWLYEVAYRAAVEASQARARRRARERQVGDVPHPEVQPVEPRDWRPVLDRELAALPQKYRSAIVLCDLEGRSRREAARQLGVAEGTLSSRLATGRRMLAERLSRRGVALSGGALAAALAEGAASARVPAALVWSTAKAAAGSLAASPAAAILVKGVLRAMFLAKLKLALGAVVVMAVLGAGGLAYRAGGVRAAPPERPRSELEELRKENELLRLNLRLVLEKFRALESELLALKGGGRADRKDLDRERQRLADMLLGAAKADEERVRKAREALGKVRDKEAADATRQLDEAVRALKEGRGPEANRRAVEALERALRQLKERPDEGGAPRRH